MIAGHRDDRHAGLLTDLPKDARVSSRAAGLRVQTAAAAGQTVSVQLLQRAAGAIDLQRRIFPGGRALGDEQVLVHLTMPQALKRKHAGNRLEGLHFKMRSF